MNTTHRFGVVLSLISLLNFAAAQVPVPGSEGRVTLKWASDYAAVLKQAREEKKPVLIDFTTDWCGWSKKMDRETFAKKDVQKELRDFLLIRINPEANDANEKLGENFSVSSYPTLVVVNYQGEESGRREGYMEEKEMLEFLREQLPLFKGNPLGYKQVVLPPDDAFHKAIKLLPKEEDLPPHQSAIIVVDHTTAEVQADGRSKMLVRTSYYVFDPEGSDLPDASLVYNPSRQKRGFKTIRILNTKGEGREIDPRLAKEENLYSNDSIYWDIKSVTVNLPALKKGQILDVIEEFENKPMVPGEFYFMWNTGAKVLLDSDFSLTFPKGMDMRKQSFVCSQPVEEKANSNGTITWRLRTSNRTQVEYEMFSAPEDYFEGYEFYANCSRDGLAKWYTDLCKGRDNLPASAIARVSEISRTNRTEMAKVQAILDWVTKDVRYVSVTFKLATHQPHSAAETLKNGYGDCKDQTLLLQALCREAGINSCPILIGYPYNTDVREDRPAVELFNHCILEATVNGKPCYLDATAGPGMAGRVPLAYAGQRALKITGSKGLAVRMPPYLPEHPETRATEIKMNANGSGTVTETYTLHGERAKESKKEVKKDQMDKLRKNMEAQYKQSGRKLLDFFVTDPEDAGTNFVTRISYTAPRVASKTSAGLLFRMGQENDEWLDRLEMPRTKPFYFASSDWSQVETTVILPGKLKEQPADLELKLPFMEASRKLTLNGNALKLTEATRTIGTRMDAKSAGEVAKAFRQLSEHRSYSFIVESPSADPSK